MMCSTTTQKAKNTQKITIDNLREHIEKTADYNFNSDWSKVNIEPLRNVERNIPFVYPKHIGNNFSHIIPSSSSQQYHY
ncbi:hypothetical protein [Fodinibius sp. AD559]|uniref:hypothetical protein n=1 Tax=Fodinibius sp. AD559 TaxID=3424179 RepID=UPI004046B5FC